VATVDPPEQRDFLGWRDWPEERRGEFVDRLIESAEDEAAIRRAYERRMEDLGYIALNYAAGSYDMRPETRRKIRERAYLRIERDPVIQRAVELLNWYVFGDGVPEPVVPVKQGTRILSEQERAYAQDVIHTWWEDPVTQAVISTLDAQEAIGVDLQADGEVFFALQDGDGATSQGGDPTEDSALYVSTFDAGEIQTLIPKQANKRQVLWYERRWQAARYDFRGDAGLASGQFIVDPTPMRAYYQDWQTEEDAEDDLPPLNRIDGETKVLHLRVNRASRNLRGQSELRSVLEWAKGFEEYMESRLMVARAMHKVAQHIQVEGGPTEVQKVLRQFAMGDPMAIRGRPLLGSPEGAPVSVRSGSVNIEPANFETGAGTAMVDRQSFLGMIGAGTDWPPHYLDGIGAQSLANLTALELPVLKKVQSRQKRWREAFSDMAEECLRRGGVENITVVIKMPLIVQRDIAVFAAAIAAVVQALDPNAANRPLRRWAAREVINAFDPEEPERIVDEAFPAGQEDVSRPPGYVDPAEMAKLQASLQPTPSAGAVGGGSSGASGNGAGTPNRNASERLGRMVRATVGGRGRGTPHGTPSVGGHSRRLAQGEPARRSQTRIRTGS
jgi:hypothetical protein